MDGASSVISLSLSIWQLSNNTIMDGFNWCITQHCWKGFVVLLNHIHPSYLFADFVSLKYSESEKRNYSWVIHRSFSQEMMCLAHASCWPWSKLLGTCNKLPHKRNFPLFKTHHLCQNLLRVGVVLFLQPPVHEKHENHVLPSNVT